MSEDDDGLIHRLRTRADEAGYPGNELLLEAAAALEGPLSPAGVRYYALIHPGSRVRGVITERPQLKEQDAYAVDGEGFVVVFFPKLDFIGSATLDWPNTWGTLSKSPEAAIAKFMDGIKQGEKWDTYQDAGHCVRRIRIVDDGPA